MSSQDGAEYLQEYLHFYTEYLLSIYPGNWDHGAAVVVAVVGGTGSRLQDTDHRWTAALYSATLQPVTNSIFCNQDVQTQPSVTGEWRSPQTSSYSRHTTRWGISVKYESHIYQDPYKLINKPEC